MFYSYLSIGTLNLKFASGGPAGALLHCSPTFAPSSQRTALSVRGLCYTVRRPLLLRRKGRLSVLMIRFRWVRSKPFAPSSQSMAQPSLCGHQQQQACNTIRGGTGSRTTGLRPVTPRLVVGNGLRPFCVDSEFGLVFYSYLSIGTLNLKFASGGPAGALLHCSPTFAPSSQRTALSVRGLLLHCSPTFAPSSQRTALSVDDPFPLG